jgi:hypothetical protein
VQGGAPDTGGFGDVGQGCGPVPGEHRGGGGQDGATGISLA